MKDVKNESTGKSCTCNCQCPKGQICDKSSGTGVCVPQNR